MSTRCAGEKTLADLPLPILEERRSAVRRSKSRKWRALALVATYLLIAVHVAHWKKTGSTMTPLEPSESMEFSISGVVNAGLIFFALTIASTMVFGRWFCGWACHVVALQDGSRWLLEKVGLRPRAVNLGILGSVPWIAFAYMFLAPILQRLLHGVDVSPSAVHLTTSDFWKTFPSIPVALFTFFVCGFIAVYVLGSKGFCSYGCPYGAIFGVADQIAPMRIRVTDACDGCGHCTAVCTSNVKVHQEVRDYGAVVDPGCMKHLDCVSVCPKDALYVGFGPPALATGRRAGSPQTAAKLGSALAGLALQACFFGATYALLLDFDEDLARIPDVETLVILLTALSLAVAAVFRGKAQRKPEHSQPEQALLGGTFLAAMYAFRGFQGGVPLLLALGLSGILAYLVVQGLRLAYRRDLAIQRHVLRASGKLTGAGAIFALALLPLGAVWGYAGWSRHELRSSRDEVRSSYAQGRQFAEEGRFEAAIAALRRTIEIDPGYLDAGMKLASVLCDAGRLDEGIAQFREEAVRDPKNAEARALLALALMQKGDGQGAREELERAVAIAPARAEFHGMLADVCAALGDAAAAERHRAEAARLHGIVPP